MVNCQNKARTTNQFFSGTLNVQSLTSKKKRKCLDKFFVDYNLEVLYLQETKTKNDETMQQKNSNLHSLFFSIHHYSQRFAVSKKRTNLIKHYISDKVVVLEDNLEGAHFKVMNCYEPTQILSNKKRKIYGDFFEVFQANIKQNQTKYSYYKETLMRK